MKNAIKTFAALLLVAALAYTATAIMSVKKPVEEMGSVWLGEMRFANTLHATTKGMKYWYLNGIGKEINIPYEKMFCSKCHATCESCHGVRDASGKVVDFSLKKARSMETCLHCHGRQKLAYKLGEENPKYADVHIHGLGVGCTFCHTSLDVHGMHGDFRYMFDKGGVFNTSCESCHLRGYAPRPYTFIDEHKEHLKDISCIACHSPTVITCYSCHLSYAYEKYVTTGKPVKKAIPIVGWAPLVRDARTGKVTLADFMVIVWNANGTEAVRVDIAQFFPHIVTEKGRTCKDCHGIEAAKMLLKTRELKLVWVENGEVKHLTGVIPIVNGTTLIMQTFVWNETLSRFQPFKVVRVNVDNNTLIEDTLPLTWKDLEKMAKTPEELMREKGVG